MLKAQTIERLFRDQLDFFLDELVDWDARHIPAQFNIAGRIPTSSESLVNDLGDYIQYLFAAAEISGHRQAEVQTLLDWILDPVDPDVLYDKISTAKGPFRTTLDRGDFLVGLNCMLYSGVSEQAKERILDTIDVYLELMYRADGTPRSSLHYRGLPIPVIYWYSVFNDVEELVHVYKYTGESRYLERARRIYSHAGEYLRHGIPTIASMSWRPVNALKNLLPLNQNRTVLSKTMSNYCSAGLALAELTSDVDAGGILDLLIEHFFDPKEGWFSTWANEFSPDEYNLGQNHPALSLFVDFEVAHPFPYRDLIERLIEQNADYPYHFFERRTFHLDSVVDFATLLLKLHCRTDEVRYRDRAEHYLEYIIDNNRTRFGFYIIEDSGVTNTLFSTKFQGLVLKPYVVYHYLLSGRSCMDDPFCYLLSRDR